MDNRYFKIEEEDLKELLRNSIMYTELIERGYINQNATLINLIDVVEEDLEYYMDEFEEI